MSNIPDPPKWNKNDVNISSTIQSELFNLSKIGFEKDLKSMINEAQDLNYNVLGYGSGRLVLTSKKLPDKTVAKIARVPRGNTFNQNEKWTYEKTTKNNIRPYLTPVLQSSNGTNRWIISPKCNSGSRDIVLKLKDILDYYNANYEEIELVEPNVGTYGGAPCIIDYDNLL